MRTPSQTGWRARPDVSLLIITALLTVIGFLMILSASAPAAQVQLADSMFFFKKQVIWGALGIVALAVGMALPLDRIRSYSKPALLVTGVLMLSVHLPHVGMTVYGATRWIKLGPITLQPSELAKLALVLFVSDFLARHPERGWKLVREHRQILLPVAGTLGLVLFQPDLGTTLVCALVCYVLFWLNGTALWRMGLITVVGVTAVLAHSLTTPYQRLRWLAFMDPWKYPKDIGFQLIQSLLAIGSGGVFGTGWGQGKQKLFYLPIQHADFIFAVLAEELGLLGSVALIALFLLFAQRGFAIAKRSQNPFHQMLVIGLTTIICAQAFVNIGVVSAALPTTGIPLPFLSAGGTSLCITLFSVGIILNVSRQSQVRLRLLKQGESA
ncbi:MAG TPA: putative lipid II flippase FtsW [Pantanalinema sp.]